MGSDQWSNSIRPVNYNNCFKRKEEQKHDEMNELFLDITYYEQEKEVSAILCHSGSTNIYNM